ncbi:MAG: hypothetical protein FWB80_02485 [Defluviitaleaceae bacterium]|nr:hypothetical protein [Defluviitaleaceae bacterium]
MDICKIDDFLINTGLYRYVSFSDDECGELATLLCIGEHSYNQRQILHKFDAFCPLCKKETVYTLLADSIAPYSHVSELRNRRRIVYSACSRDNSHRITFWLHSSDKGVAKIGQDPSVKEILTSSISRYRKLLGKDLIELQTAIQLHSHGVGIGSFVYLRRIFENLIITAFEENKFKYG